jgi:hypothetical protein
MAEAQVQFGNAKKGERLPLEAVIGRLMKTQLHAIANFRACEMVIALELIIDMSYKMSINLITNPNPLCSHAITHDN